MNTYRTEWRLLWQWHRLLDSGRRRWRCVSLLLLLASLVFSGCGKKDTGAGQALNKPGTPDYIPPAKSQEFVVNGQIDLPALTVALREYCHWKMRVPKDINELVASKYLTNLPTPSSGQNYAIDPTRIEVTLVSQ